jgi:hypothetical protein
MALASRGPRALRSSFTLRLYQMSSSEKDSLQ